VLDNAGTVVQLEIRQKKYPAHKAGPKSNIIKGVNEKEERDVLFMTL
jgi:hypothetical protein